MCFLREKPMWPVALLLVLHWTMSAFRQDSQVSSGDSFNFKATYQLRPFFRIISELLLYRRKTNKVLKQALSVHTPCSDVVLFCSRFVFLIVLFRLNCFRIPSSNNTTRLTTMCNVLRVGLFYSANIEIIDNY